MEGFSFLLFLIDLFSMFMVSNSADSLSTTQLLTDGKTMISEKARFEMGFFSPESSRNRFLGIWYKHVSPTTVVWVANRENPINDTLGVLRVNEQGILNILNGTKDIIWSSNYSRSTRNPIAQLLDTGNLVVRDANVAVDPKNFLWQSFDYPGDTFMPGMKLGKSFVTGMEWALRSWKSSSDPSRGDFVAGIDTHGYPQLGVKNVSAARFHFRFGSWNGLRFSGYTTLKPNPVFRYNFEFNKEEVYYHFELINDSVYSRVVIDANGILQRLTWNVATQDWNSYFHKPDDSCDTYELCHGYGICPVDNSPALCACLDKFVPKDPRSWSIQDWSSGCVRRMQLDCQKGDGFIKYSGVKLPDTQDSWYNTSMTLKECKRFCLKNCSCMAYTNLDIRNGGSGCLVWFGELMDMRALNEFGQDIYIRVASSEIESKWTKGRKIRVSLAVLAGLILLGLLLGLIYCFYARDKQQDIQPPHQMEAIYNSELFHPDRSQNEDLDLPMFDLERIAIATDNFAGYNKLGEGGFGTVYKGMLENGQVIAVKRLSKHSTQGIDEFKNEVIFIAKLQHRNLVKLLGCCIQGQEKMLIYEYMPNNSLEFCIFDETQRTMMDWPKRFNIINGIARGLLYLHQDSPLRIIHRDLKASNILLDIDMNPKISDFGMARSFGGNEMEGNTRRVVGTYGYMSPEYIVDGLFSVKSDVFSFGVLVLEIISGKKNRGFIHPKHHHNLLGHAWLLFKEGKIIELVDTRLVDHLSEVLRSIHIGLLCVQQHPEDRPSMSSVVLMLNGEGVLSPPKEPGFFTERNMFFEPNTLSSNFASTSGNEISITLLEPR